MIRRFGREPFLWSVLIVTVAVFLVRFVLFEAAGNPARELTLVRLACVVKLFFLACGAYYAFRSAVFFGPGNPIRPAWMLLGLGLAASFLGQAVLGRYQFFGPGQAPFPSAADFFFLASYPLFAVSLMGFLRGYVRGGYMTGEQGLLWALGFLIIAAIGFAAFPVARPIFLAQAPLIEKLLNAAYLTLDFVILAPATMLLLVAVRLRGGSVSWVWFLLAAAFLFMFAGDVLFAYSEWGKKHLDPLVHATYLMSYGLLALGVVRQARALSA